jgi:hypothetical protein
MKILSTLGFHVPSGWMQMILFHREEVRCLSLIIMKLSHFTSYGKCISFPLMYYVDILVQRPQLISCTKIFYDSFVLCWIIVTSFYLGGDSSHSHQSYLHYFLRGLMPLDQDYTTFLLGSCFMNVCSCGGICYSRGYHWSGCIIWLVGKYVIF